ncbi:hypothetical protein MHBO_002204 [Bonamia ostreae]|uniref:Mitochondrial import receptor subunit tom22 n=1 Tax=Bonamia ostreae TaxID=126728 RepID=A0ABV2AMK8_9EUKA
MQDSVAIKEINSSDDSSRDDSNDWSDSEDGFDFDELKERALKTKEYILHYGSKILKISLSTAFFFVVPILVGSIIEKEASEQRKQFEEGNVDMGAPVNMVDLKGSSNIPETF